MLCPKIMMSARISSALLSPSAMYVRPADILGLYVTHEIGPGNRYAQFHITSSKCSAIKEHCKNHFPVQNLQKSLDILTDTIHNAAHRYTS